ncbi:hypothetical protein EJ08DRAFT_450427 [Tothia fuscella]|uniref:Uncharacterized protein n=1 Tax=Tothia fuscella TaxID=1048955 RepID=A0A9P4TUE5_9PEZI|nr:hypothetical protein EJ08DRAFT_450427 [Tothia fuscella]
MLSIQDQHFQYRNTQYRFMNECAEQNPLKKSSPRATMGLWNGNLQNSVGDVIFDRYYNFRCDNPFVPATSRACHPIRQYQGNLDLVLRIRSLKMRIFNLPMLLYFVLVHGRMMDLVSLSWNLLVTIAFEVLPQRVPSLVWYRWRCNGNALLSPHFSWRCHQERLASLS